MNKISLILIGYSYLRYEQIKNIYFKASKFQFSDAFDIFICLDGLKVNSTKTEINKRTEFNRTSVFNGAHVLPPQASGRVDVVLFKMERHGVQDAGPGVQNEHWVMQDGSPRSKISPCCQS